ncbi:glycosyltransferase [Propionibacteriaceae bacterium G1746]|uniref:glycosyltransferase n=1 Tax=Aestuariimicrobium sp. G57 TaxID=3418485 RepID=UPI003C23DC33
MPRAVVLLTNVFPFHKGEEFLENEIGHLAAGFDRVVIVATQVPADASQTRTVPDNCTVLRAGGPRPTGLAAATTVARGALHVLRRGPGGAPLHPGKVATESLFEGRAQQSMRELAPQLDALGLGSFEQVVVYSYWLHVTARVGMLLADELRRRGVAVGKLVSRAHRYDLYPEESPFGHVPERGLLLGAYDEVHPVSDHGTALLQRTWPRFAPKVTTRRLGTRDPGAPVECRQQPARVVSCSFVVPVKRVDRIPGILAGLEGGVAWTHYGSAGQGSAGQGSAGQGTGDLLDQVRTEAEQTLGPGHADLPGYVANAELADRYRELRPVAFLNVSESEGVPVSIMEVIALGIPVVATDVGGVGEIVIDGVNGYLLPKDFEDAQAASALNALVTAPPERYAEICRAARARWEEAFNEAVVYPAFVQELTRPPLLPRPHQLTDRNHGRTAS